MSSSTKTKHGRVMLLLFLCLFLLLASGRMDSGDANAELAGSMNLVESGGLGTSVPYSDDLVQSLFVQAPNGRYYEAHEVGNSLLLTPAAIGGSVAGRVKGGGDSVKLKTLVAKTLGSLLETVLSAVSCYYLFLLFGLFYKPRVALALTGLFIFATFYAAYFRTGWDVLPACNAVILLLYCSAKLLLAPAVGVREAVPVALWYGIACMFRFSLAPFLGLSLLIVLWNVRQKISRSAIVSTASVAVALFLPTLMFNAIRTGSPFRPANTLPQFAFQTSLSGNIFKGMFGLLLSSNHGLFIYSPILLLMVLLPFFWKSMPSAVRLLLAAYLPAAFLYYLMISKMVNWGAAGWGPRYLLPLLPVLFLGAGSIAYELWRGSGARRLLVASLCVVALLLSVPTLLVDYSNAVKQDPDYYKPATIYPTPHIAVWRSMLAVHGRPSQANGDASSADEAKLASAFPDLLVTRVYQVTARRSTVAGVLLVLLYLGVLGAVVYRLWLWVGRREASAAVVLSASDNPHIPFLSNAWLSYEKLERPLLPGRAAMLQFIEVRLFSLENITCLFAFMKIGRTRLRDCRSCC